MGITTEIQGYILRPFDMSREQRESVYRCWQYTQLETIMTTFDYVVEYSDAESHDEVMDYFMKDICVIGLHYAEYNMADGILSVSYYY